ncbi:hypothetical protein LPJ61_003789 [Coemansia biformis]|uniref:Uncharacterized protein n=1 Tax=Coemansia biformis TaxID=1286918 RepID=A0A9W8CYA1_9FUNG|nr:hypothetical protein LPJ61_003789 [Coemansia biformis]
MPRRLALSQHLPDETPGAARALGRWASELQGGDSWTTIVETLADWAVHSTLLRCVRGDDADTGGCLSGTGTGNADKDLGESEIVPWMAGTLSAALVSFWDAGGPSRQDGITSSTMAGKRAHSGGSEMGQSLACGALVLARLVSLENESPSPTAKYRGYVVKKRRVVQQPSAGGSGGAEAGTRDAGTLVIPSGVGTIEPLLDAAILVGTCGEEDVHIPMATNGMLRRRDGESLYIKRWRYAHTLANRATHEARVAAGEIEETEEGEEREDGEDAVPDNEPPAEDWPDPDNGTTLAEDALRRVCVATSSMSLRWWRQMQMRPIGATAIAEWYLGDVDSAYQAAHFGTHKPLGLQRALDGVFTQQTKGTMPLPADQGRGRPPPAQWSARLRYEAERLGRCAAHAWYTTSQQEQEKRAGDGAHDLRRDATGLAVAATPAAVVLYMLVPHPRELAPWAALSEAATLAIQAFGQPMGEPDGDGGRQQHTAAADRPLYTHLVSHPLRSGDSIGTLHCVYTVFGSAAGSGPWAAVCWCDERGEYVEHDVFSISPRPAGGAVGAVDPAAAARIWRGCLRYQALFGGQLRVVLAEWQGMSMEQARAWHEYGAAWHAHTQQHGSKQGSKQGAIYLHLASIGASPSEGLRLARETGGHASSPAGCSSSSVAGVESADQWSLVLHAQPHIAFAAPQRSGLEEPMGACSQRACPTGYLVLQDRHRTCTGDVPCLCVQLLDDAALGQPCSSGPKARALVVRAILRQYHQLACLANAELDAAGRTAQAPAARVGCWPAHLLPLPVAIVTRIRAAVELLLPQCAAC